MLRVSVYNSLPKFLFFIILTHGLNNLHQINMYNVDANITHRTYLLVKEYLYREI